MTPLLSLDYNKNKKADKNRTGDDKMETEMTLDTLITDHLINKVFGESTVIHALKDYLYGKTDIEPNVKDLHFYPNYRNQYGASLLNDDAHFQSEENAQKLRQAVKRFYHTFSHSNPDELIDNFKHLRRRYNYYRLAELDADFVKKDLQQTGTSCLKHCHLCENEIRQQSLDEFIQEAQNNGYSSLLYDCIVNYEKDIKDNPCAVGTIILFFRRLYQKDPSYLPLKKEAERIVYTLLKQCFSDQELRETFTQYIQAEEALTYFDTFCPVENLSFPPYNKYLLFMACNLCQNISPVLDQGLKVAFILLDTFVYHRYRVAEKTAHYWKLSKKWNFPLQTDITFCIAGILELHTNEKNRLAYKQQINRLLQKNSAQLIKLYFAKKNYYGCYLLAHALKHNTLEETEKNTLLEQSDNILLAALQSLTNNGKPFFEFDDNSSYNFDTMKTTEFDMNFPLGRVNFRYSNSITDLLKLCFFLLDYSLVARNSIKVLLADPTLSIAGFIYLNYYDEFRQDQTKNIYESLFEMGFSFSSLINLFFDKRNHFYGSFLQHSSSTIKKEKEEFLQFLKAHKTQAEESIATLHLKLVFPQNLISYLELLFEESTDFDIRFILDAFQWKSKRARDYVETFLLRRKTQAYSIIEPLLQGKNKQLSNMAARLLKQWDTDKTLKKLSEIKDINALTALVKTQYIKDNETNIPFPKEIEYTAVRLRDSEEKAPELLLKFYLSEYILQKELSPNAICEKIEAFLNPSDFKKLLKTIFELWISDGCKPKYKNIIFPIVLTADKNELLELQGQIDYWCQNKKPSLAVFTVQTLIKNDSPFTLLFLDIMSKKHKTKKVRTACLAVLEQYQKEKNMTKEEFQDFMIPDLGFDKNRKHIFEYGERKFTAILNHKLEISLQNEEGKEIKNLPDFSVRQKDNETMVTLCKKEFSFLKKQLKAIVQAQKTNLFLAILTGRTWSSAKWKALFIENPIMTTFAQELIWGEYDEAQNLIGTFRYLEDGTFNTAEEEEYTILENSFLSLIHPCQLEETVLTAWKEQLKDYEIIQPIKQLELPIFSLTEENKAQTKLTQFQEKKISLQTLKNKAALLGFEPVYESAYQTYKGGIWGSKYTGNVQIRFTVSDWEDSDFVVKINQFSFFQKGQCMDFALPLEAVSPKLLSIALYAGMYFTQTAQP